MHEHAYRIVGSDPMTTIFGSSSLSSILGYFGIFANFVTYIYIYVYIYIIYITPVFGVEVAVALSIRRDTSKILRGAQFLGFFNLNLGEY